MQQYTHYSNTRSHLSLHLQLKCTCQGASGRRWRCGRGRVQTRHAQAKCVPRWRRHCHGATQLHGSGPASIGGGGGGRGLGIGLDCRHGVALGHMGLRRGRGRWLGRGGCCQCTCCSCSCRGRSGRRLAGRRGRRRQRAGLRARNFCLGLDHVVAAVHEGTRIVRSTQMFCAATRRK